LRVCINAGVSSVTRGLRRDGWRFYTVGFS
jgi:hypothetical protein